MGRIEEKKEDGFLFLLPDSSCFVVSRLPKSKWKLEVIDQDTAKRRYNKKEMETVHAFAFKERGDIADHMEA